MTGWNLTGTTPPAEEADALTVSQAIEAAAGALERIPQMTVLGEVTGFRGPNARSGHCYFQIKDESCSMDCIIWKGSYLKRTFDLRDGMQVQLTGSFNLYKAVGKMSFVARSFSLAGEGLLRQQVAALAEKLRREGLMDESRRRRIPAFCTRVAVVTSLTGAVIDDVKRTLRRRNPLVELVCVGSKVQGEGAPADLIDALGRASRIVPAPDCILLIRGGGSYEDLMAFNDESLARAVASCPVPVVTGIGHEPDTSICDMVSDRRCSTPTAAAESVAPSMSELADALDGRERRMRLWREGTVRSVSAEADAARERLDRAMSARLARAAAELDAAASRPCLARPGAVYEQRAAELDLTAERLAGSWAHAVQRRRAELESLAPRLAAATGALSRRGHELELAASRLAHAGSGATAPLAASLAAAAGKLDALSPLKVLARGYSIAFGESGVVASADDVAPGSSLRVRVADGDIRATVTAVEPLASP